MDLFVVNRFTADGTNDSKTEANQKLSQGSVDYETNHTKTEENHKLKQVLKKIRKKRRHKAKQEVLATSDNELQESELFKPADIDPEVTSEKNVDSTSAKLDTNDYFNPDEPVSKKAKITNPISIEGFTILGIDKFDKKQVVQRVLPKWLRNPTIISTDLQNLSETVSSADLNNNLKIRLKENKITHLFPVQAGFIPWQLRQSKQSNVLHPPDVCVSAATGSGKTLAFVIPVLQHLLDKLENRNMTVKAVRALLVLPTQNLAQQIYEAFKSYSSGTDVTIGIITSSTTTFRNEQKLLVTNNSVWGSASRSDILICTAGRLIDHLKNTKGFDLKYLEYIIIDEADRVLDSMQDDWLRHLGMHLQSARENFVGRNVLSLASIQKRSEPQKLLFSATLSSDPEKLEKLSLFQPKLFTCVSSNEATNGNNENTERFIGKYTTPDELVEKYVTCSVEVKPLVLYKLILDTIQGTETPKIIVFVNDKDTLHRLTLLLCFMAKKKFTIKEISDETPKHMSKELLESFAAGNTNVLICTNLIARGMDIPNVDCVISYNAPTHIKTYVHRAGRTARGGMKGLCITMLEAHEEGKFLNMLRKSRTTISMLEKIHTNEDELESLSALYKKSLIDLKFKVNREKRHHLFKTKQRKQVLRKYY